MPLTVVMTTYAPTEERAKYAKQVVESLAKHLDTVDGWKLHIADDGTPDEIFQEYYAPLTERFTIADRLGIGGSLNLALHFVSGDWLYITDDWVLTRQLDVRPAIRLIRDLGYDYVRINPLHPNLRCVTQHHDGMWWLHLDHIHPDGGFYFATRPFIATKRFYDRVGPFKEYADAYDTEKDYSDRVNAYNSLLPMAALVDMHGGWSHIGEYPVGRIQLERPAGV